MKRNWSIFTNTAFTITLLTSATLSANAKDVDIHLDSLDADGHLSILEAEEYSANDHTAVADQEILVEDYGADSHAELVAAKETVIEDHGADSYGKAGAADSHKGDHGTGSSDRGFLSKHTTEIEFTFAILVIVVGLIASEKFQRAQDEQQLAIGGGNGNNLVRIEDDSDYQDLPRVG